MLGGVLFWSKHSYNHRRMNNSARMTPTIPTAPIRKTRRRVTNGMKSWLKARRIVQARLSTVTKKSPSRRHHRKPSINPSKNLPPNDRQPRGKYPHSPQASQPGQSPRKTVPNWIGCSRKSASSCRARRTGPAGYGWHESPHRLLQRSRRLYLARYPL